MQIACQAQHIERMTSKLEITPFTPQESALQRHGIFDLVTQLDRQAARPVECQCCGMDRDAGTLKYGFFREEGLKIIVMIKIYRTEKVEPVQLYFYSARCMDRLPPPFSAGFKSRHVHT
jgi:hypothetical protein